MRLCSISIRRLLIIVILIVCYQQKPYAQNEYSKSENLQGLFVGLSFGPSQSKMIYEGIPSTLNLNAATKSGHFGTLELGYTFSNYFAISSGLGFISYRNRFSLDSYQNEFTTIDSENETYSMRVTGSDIKEEQKIDLLTIPFCVRLRLPLSDNIGMFVKTGINLSVPVNKKFTTSGTYTYKGYYPKYNVLLEDLPEIGFSSNKSVTKESNLKLNSLYFTPTVSAGLDFYLKENIQIVVAASYNTTVLKEAPSSVSSAESPANFKLSQDADHFNSLMGVSNKVTAQSIGIECTLRFYL